MDTGVKLFLAQDEMLNELSGCDLRVDFRHDGSAQLRATCWRPDPYECEARHRQNLVDTVFAATDQSVVVAGERKAVFQSDAVYNAIADFRKLVYDMNLLFGTPAQQQVA